MLKWENHITRDLFTELPKKYGYPNYFGLDQEIFVLRDLKNPSLMWVLGHSVLDVQVFSSNESRVEFSEMAYEINEFSA